MVSAIQHQLFKPDMNVQQLRQLHLLLAKAPQYYTRCVRCRSRSRSPLANATGCTYADMAKKT